MQLRGMPFSLLASRMGHITQIHASYRVYSLRIPELGTGGGVKQGFQPENNFIPLQLRQHVMKITGG
jgi:hypothetical protein